MLSYSVGLICIFASLTAGFSPSFGVASRRATFLFSSSTEKSSLLSVTLEKPLGLMLEEVEEGAAKGVKVQDLSEAGSAYASEYKDQLMGLKISSVQGVNVGAFTFDDVMEKIIEAPSPVTIVFGDDVVTTEVTTEEVVASEPELAVGTAVTIKVLQEGKPDMDIDAKVGDNLRTVLLENKVEVYRGLKKKLGNCGGSGQCYFCAVEMTETEGWGERSDYEDEKIGKKLGPDARLACLNNIQGPATVRTL
jgi:ferredoxin